MAASCIGCAHLRSFKPRIDEQARYGFGDTGWECRKRGWEGYVVQPSSAPCGGILFAQAIEARRAETGTGSVHESAVVADHAPDPQSPSPHSPLGEEQ